jgi:hypothetical protein
MHTIEEFKILSSHVLVTYIDIIVGVGIIVKKKKCDDNSRGTET